MNPFDQDDVEIAIWLDKKGRIKYIQHGRDGQPEAWDRLEQKDEKGCTSYPLQEIKTINWISEIIMLEVIHANPGCCRYYIQGGQWRWKRC